jgi:hypothetical protein
MQGSAESLSFRLRLYDHSIGKHGVSEDLSPYHAELAVASGKPTSGLHVIQAQSTPYSDRLRPC